MLCTEYEHPHAGELPISRKAMKNLRDLRVLRGELGFSGLFNPDCPLGRNSTPTPPNLPLSGGGQTEHSPRQGGAGGGFEANGLFGVKYVILNKRDGVV